jgi:aspartyl-tRNA(Asn)/glutamyl-tRNA(Gln) amidotransferase subunit A
MTAELARLDLVSIASLIRRGKASSAEVVRASLDRIEAWQPHINAFIAVEADAALDEARRCDEETARGICRGPLHGVPLAFKDAFYRRGKICSAGSAILRDSVAGDTATVIDRLERAGMICLGRLGMSEFAADPTGHNAHYGACGNPWNPAYIPGASSSGSGAALGARLVYGSLGSDTGGSIRLPAAACGVVGLMPTHGRVSRHGVIPRAWSLDRPGPMARTARDCAVLLGIIAGHDPRDSLTSAEPVPDYRRGLGAGIKGLRIGIPEALGPDVTPEVCNELDRSQAILRSLGAELRPIRVPDALGLFRLNDIILKAEAAAIHGKWLRQRPLDYADYFRVRIEAGLLIPATQYIEALALRGRMLERFLDESLGEVDLLHYPAIPRALPTLAEATLVADDPETLARAASLSTYTRLFNYLGVPAISVPCGFDANGLPVGFQLVARPFGEALLLRAAHAYQQVTDWHLRMPPAPAPETSTIHQGA